MVMNSAEARKKLENARDLPTLPSVVSEIIKLANSSKTNAADVGRIIEQDQALTTKVLRLVNSAFYGFPGQIKTVQHAVVIIGFNKVKNVVMAASLFDLTKGRSSKSVNIPQFWLHALGSAIGAKEAIRRFDTNVTPDDAFVAGLIHSVGVMIIDQMFPQEYAMVRQVCLQSRCTLYEAEKSVLGFTHCHAGDWVGEKWKLPPQLRNAMNYYARPMQAKSDQGVVAAAHVGSSLARALGIGSAGDEVMMGIDPLVCQRFGVDGAMLDKIVDETLDELKLAGGFIELIGR